jgi:hypothetical protein
MSINSPKLIEYAVYLFSIYGQLTSLYSNQHLINLTIRMTSLSGHMGID